MKKQRKIKTKSEHHLELKNKDYISGFLISIPRDDRRSLTFCMSIKKEKHPQFNPKKKASRKNPRYILTIDGTFELQGRGEKLEIFNRNGKLIKSLFLFTDEAAMLKDKYKHTLLPIGITKSDWLRFFKKRIYMARLYLPTYFYD